MNVRLVTPVHIKRVLSIFKIVIQFDDCEHGLHRVHHDKVDTSLLVYFFGNDGNGLLGVQDFAKFMDHLQTEVLAMEYNEFAKGTRNTISQVDFARILLRYAALNIDE